MRTAPVLWVLISCCALPLRALAAAPTPSDPPPPPSAEVVGERGDYSLVDAPPVSEAPPSAVELAARKRARRQDSDMRVGTTLLAGTLGTALGGIGGGIAGFVLALNVFAILGQYAIIPAVLLGALGAVAGGLILGIVAAAIVGVVLATSSPRWDVPEEAPTLASQDGAAPPEEGSRPAPRPHSTDLPRHTLTVSIVHLLSSSVSAEYEQVFASHFSWFVAPVYLRVRSEDQAMDGGAITGGVRFFFMGEAPHGFFVQPQLELGYTSTSRGTDGVDTNALFAGLTGTVGYTFLFGDMVDLSVGLGLGARESLTYYRGPYIGAGSTTGLDWAPLSVRCSLGAAF